MENEQIKCKKKIKKFKTSKGIFETVLFDDRTARELVIPVYKKLKTGYKLQTRYTYFMQNVIFKLKESYFW